MATEVDSTVPPEVKIPKMENGETSSSGSSNSSGSASSTVSAPPKRKQAKENRSEQETAKSRKPSTLEVGNRRRGGGRPSASSSWPIINDRSRDEGNEADDDSMDELLADLRPLRKRGSRNSSRSSSSASTTNRSRNSNVGSSSTVEVVTSGDADVTIVVDDEDSNGNISVSLNNGSRSASLSVALRTRVNARRARTAQLQREINPRATTTSSRIRSLFPRLPNMDQDGGSGQVGEDPVVITLSDSEAEEQGPRGQDAIDQPMIEEIEYEEPGYTIIREVPTQARAERMNSTQSRAVDDDEAYARRLQAQLNFEDYRARRRQRRSQRLHALRNLFTDDVRSIDGTTGMESGAAEDRQRDTSPEMPAIEFVGSSSVHLGPTNLQAFHRRPRIQVTEAASGQAQTGRQGGSRSTQTRANSTNDSGPNRRGGDLFNGDRELLTLVDLMRMRRVWFQRAMRYGDFGPLDAALMDLAQTLGDALTEEEINRLATSVYSSSNAGTSSSSNTTCTICMEEFVDEEVQRHLPCAHTFHKDCIDKWLKQKCTCPICRVDARGTSQRP